MTGGKVLEKNPCFEVPGSDSSVDAADMPPTVAASHRSSMEPDAPVRDDSAYAPRHLAPMTASVVFARTWPYWLLALAITLGAVLYLTLLA